MLPRRLLVLLSAALIVACGLIAVRGALSGPPRWVPDGLFYQARSLELRGTDTATAQRRVFQGAPGADLRRTDPTRSGDPRWVAFNAPFYERRVAVPAAAALVAHADGDRALLDVSLAGYFAALLALFAFLLLRFRLVVATGVTLAAALVPALSGNAQLPLTDSWGLAVEIAALASAWLVLERGRRWLAGWVLALALLSLTRDNTWILIAAAAGLTLSLRSRDGLVLVGTGLLAIIPAALLFSAPLRPLLAEMLNDAQPAADDSWGAILKQYPGAIADTLRADGGYVRDGAWYSAFFLAGGLVPLVWPRLRISSDVRQTALLRWAALAAVAFVFVVPVFGALRIELVLLPMAAFGLALVAEQVAARIPALSRLRLTSSASTPVSLDAQILD